MRAYELASTLSRYSRVAVLERGEARVVVFERGGRILGIFVNDANVLWVNPCLDEVLATGGWNVGGLRLWISPERNFYYEEPERFEGWRCPSTLDPAAYKIIRVGRREVALEGKLSALDRMRGWRFAAAVRRDVMLVEENRLLIRDSMVADYPGEVNLWALAQVKPGRHGTVLVPVRRGAKPIHYFDPIPPERLVLASDHVALRIDGERVYKLGVRPEDLPAEGEAVVAYVAELEQGTWGMVCMRTHDAPRSQEECLDVAKADPEGPKGAVQSYNSGPEAGLGKFGEIELQFRPAVEVGGRKVSTVEYEVAFIAGSRDEVMEAVKLETGIKEPHVF